MRLCQSIVSVLAVSCACVGAASASDGQQHLNNILNQTPFTYLLDTGSPSATALSEAELARKTGWTIVPEDNLKHKFKGDTVFLNDKITVVLRRSGCGAEVYSKMADGMNPAPAAGAGVKQRAQLFACAGGADRTTGLSSVRIIENNPAAVMLEAVFQTRQGKNVSATYRLTTGQICLEVSAGKGMGKLLVQVDSRYVVVPDFFADDLVFNPERFKGSIPTERGPSRIGLPAENFLLHMLKGNDGIVMCVWESDKQNAQAISWDPILQEDRKMGTHIECVKDKRIWIAFMEGSNIWHERLISDEDKGRDIVLDWEPPFPAKWRADFIKKDELAESWNFVDEQESESVSAGDELACSCWFDGDRPYMRVPELQTMVGAGLGASPAHAWPVIVYPIDRSRATPLRVFCPIDILRNTLGVGPCQYILEKEGFGSESHPTADQVTRWVENLFKKKREKQASDQIEERFKHMVEHMRQTQTRIRQYGNFARDLRKPKEKQEPNKAVAAASGKLWDIVDDLEQDIILRSQASRPSESAGHLADKVIVLIGQGDALAQCQKLGSQIRAIAAVQDRALSMVAGREPQAADFAGEMQEMAEQMLQKK
ncbi:MAG: hypothetical protein ACYTBX_05035 [Planctomycetota bacterium]